MIESQACCIGAMLHCGSVVVVVVNGCECMHGCLNIQQSLRASPAGHQLVCRGQKRQSGDAVGYGDVVGHQAGCG